MMERKASENTLLIGAIASGGMTSTEIQLLLDAETAHGGDFEALARVVTGLSTSNHSARATFSSLKKHQEQLSQLLGRNVGIKAAAMDYIEYIAKDPLSIISMSNVELSKLAFRDDLTGLANFKYFSLRMKDEASRAKRYSHILSVIMIDIDHFKSFNDSFGHPEGNKVLHSVATTIQDSIRDTDMAARFGGEEFVVLLPETNKREAMEIAERIRVNVEAIKAKRKITISCGVATMGRDTFDQTQVLEMADKALYQSKNKGRNTVSKFEPIDHFASFSIKAICPIPASVVGTFNKWDKMEDEMTFFHFCELRSQIHLAPGRYEYKFLIDGKFVMDPKCKEFAPDGYGGQNCVLIVS